MKKKEKSVFDIYAQAYDAWFEKHPGIFQSELLALKKMIPADKTGIEIGTGTGRFAQQLKINTGTEPSSSMARLAIARGIVVINARAESLPLFDHSFDFAVMITTDCFLENISASFTEIYRIIKRNGNFIAGMINKESWLGKKYESIKPTSPWYKHAHFHSVPEICDLLYQAGFSGFDFSQTLTIDTEEIQLPQPGYDTGGFVVIKATKP